MPRFNVINLSLSRCTAQLFEADEIQATIFENRPNWHFIDQRSINAGREAFYNDDLHYNGPLSLATIQVVLNQLCPEIRARTPERSQKLVTWARPDLAHRVIAVGHGDTAAFYFVSTEGYAYGINLAGQGEQKGTKKECSVSSSNKSAEFENMPSYLKQHELIRMENMLVYTAKKRVPYYCPGVALRTEGGKSVFSLKKEGGIHYFNSAAEFLASGREWEEIVFIPRWELHILAGVKDRNTLREGRRMLLK